MSYRLLYVDLKKYTLIYARVINPMTALSEWTGCSTVFRSIWQTL
jgi:hypothetical protein